MTNNDGGVIVKRGRVIPGAGAGQHRQCLVTVANAWGRRRDETGDKAEGAATENRRIVRSEGYVSTEWLAQEHHKLRVRAQARVQSASSGPGLGRRSGSRCKCRSAANARSVSSGLGARGSGPRSGVEVWVKVQVQVD